MTDAARTPPVVRTSRPTSAAPALGVQRRQWNAPPSGLFPTAPVPTTRKAQHKTPPPPQQPQRQPPTPPSTQTKRLAASSMTPATARRPMTARPERERASSPSRGATSRQLATTASTAAASRLATSRQEKRDSTRDAMAPSHEDRACSRFVVDKRRMSALTEVQKDAIARGSPTRLSQVTWARLQKAMDEAERDLPFGRLERINQLAHSQALDAAAAARVDAVRSAQVKKSLNKQDVEADDVRPLIDIAYWSPFLEVRRDAAAAIASLSRNAANLELLSDVGALGALVSMLSATDNRVDPEIARDCAHALANLAKLDSVKIKVLQSPDGLECVFALMHSFDLKLRSIAFELVNNLVTIEELRQAIAKREGFAFMLDSCTSRDSRIRLLAASILHHLAESRDNRFLFYHSTHFRTLAEILQDPFIERDIHFRRELLGFVHLLVSEEDNGRKFVELGLIPTLLLILDAPKTNHHACLLVVLILESLALNRKNHAALVAANALPKIVQVCFCSSRGMDGDKAPAPRPRSARALGRGKSPAASAALASAAAATAPPATVPMGLTVTMSPEVTALLRPAFTLFCEMARNPVNRDHVIRSKLIDYVSARNLYAASDKRVRRAVITLLTFLICRERERERRASALARGEDRDSAESSSGVETMTTTAPPTQQQQHGDAPGGATSDAEFKHYIELLARGVVKCLFGILSGNDFTMKVDAIAAIAELTADEHSRLTLCKPPLLRSLQEFAFHPLIQTRTNIARILANFAERPENALKLVDEGMLGILVKYVCPISRNNDVLVEATRAIAALSVVHVTRNRLVESGVLGTLIQFCKSPSTSPEVQGFARAAIRNLRHDAAALRIQAIYRGWCVRMHHARSILTRRRRLRKMTSLRKMPVDVMERLVIGS